MLWDLELKDTEGSSHVSPASGGLNDLCCYVFTDVTLAVTIGSVCCNGTVTLFLHLKHYHHLLV